jgi:hypothetical protein
MDNQKAKLKKTGSKINGEKMESQKGKKKGKNGWKKTEATKKEKKKENKRNTNVKGKPICFHMFRRPKVC